MDRVAPSKHRPAVPCGAQAGRCRPHGWKAVPLPEVWRKAYHMVTMVGGEGDTRKGPVLIHRASHIAVLALADRLPEGTTGQPHQSGQARKVPICLNHLFGLNQQRLRKCRSG
jgi:hypothetical protein